MPDTPVDSPVPDQRFGELCLVAAAVTHVTSIVPVFFQGQGPQEAWFPVVQSGEFLWRYLDGLGDEPELRQDAPPRVAELLARVEDRATPFGRAAAGAIRGAQAAYRAPAGEPGGTAEVVAMAIEVALAFDEGAVPPPEGCRSWSAFELQALGEVGGETGLGQPALTGDALFDLRMRSGAVAMKYRNSYSEWRAG